MPPISCAAGLPLSVWFGHRRSREPVAFPGAAGVQYFLRGSGALWQGLQGLRTAGTGTVLFPAYHCGIELDAVIQAGFQVAFYEVGDDLRVDPDRLRQRAPPDLRAIFVIHYFGFPQDLREVRLLCRELGCALIEDCAQALLAQDDGGPVGGSGDVALFSLSKILPVPSGGALVVNNPRYLREAPSKASPRADTLRTALLLWRRELGRSPVPVLRWLRWFRRRPIEPEVDRPGSGPPDRASDCPATAIRFRPEWEGLRMSRLSRHLFGRMDFDGIRERRRQNYAALLRAAAGCRRLSPLISTLPAGACPGYFPVTVASSPSAFIRWARQRGVMAERFWIHVHPRFPADRFPAAARLKREVILLPVHQDLTNGDLERLRQLIRDWECGDEAGGVAPNPSLHLGGS